MNINMSNNDNNIIMNNNMINNDKQSTDNSININNSNSNNNKTNQNQSQQNISVKSQDQQTNTRHKAPVEFNHAINYVNKIKMRFLKEPEIYKRFLEVLQTYQKEQRPINEVYSQVKVLFKNAEDLLNEFKQFLPDNGNSTITDTKPILNNQIDNIGNKKIQNQSQPVSTTKKTSKRQATTVNNVNTISANAPPAKKPRISFMEENSGTIEELEFFEKAKKVIGNKTTYFEFLKILNLFSQDIIDSKTLVESVEPFLSRSPELFYWFKTFVKYEEEIEPEIVAPKYHDVDYTLCLRAGHSYRLLPLSLTHPKCSGRDKLCYEVLNDEYVSHPIFLSEDGGFQAQKRNPFEDAMHRCEEERYDFDLFITKNSLTIALFESIMAKMDKMTNEEKSKFKLPSDLGSKSPSIFRKIIRKIYDKERGEEVILALQNSPSIAVPIVLKRLKQKDEEWKKAKKEWSKVWREIHNKNFYKSLDHRFLLIKQSDKKNIAVKSLIHEVETLHAEQLKKRDSNATYQYSLSFKDATIFGDMKKIIRCYLRNCHNFNESDIKRIIRFLNEFIPKFFHIKNIEDDNDYDDDDDDENDNDNDNDNEKINTTDESHSTETATENDLSESKNESINIKTNNDLRKKILIKSHENNKIELDNISCTNSTYSLGESTNNENEITESVESSEETQKLKKLANENLKIKTFRPIFLLFGNNVFYCFFRLYHKLYERLLNLKTASEKMAKEPDQLNLINPIAVELGLVKKEVIQQNAEFCRKGRYSELLKLIRHFFEDTHENQEFEEKARILFVNQAYQIFTVDKIVQAIAKQIQVITNDNVCQELIKLYNKDCEKDLHSQRREAIYKLSVKTFLQDENLFKFEYNNLENILTIQLLSKEDYLTDSTISSEEKWSVYVDRYMQLGTTEGIHIKPNEPFLRRNLPQIIPDEPPTNLIMHSGLELKICVNSYKLFFVNNTEDYFRRCNAKLPNEKLEILKNNRRNKFIKWFSKVSNISEKERGKSLDFEEKREKRN
jgi:paired amphipathic helix protein Sin3a